MRPPPAARRTASQPLGRETVGGPCQNAKTMARPPLLTPEAVARAGRLHAEGVAIDEIAAELRVSRRTAFRAVEKVRPEPLPPPPEPERPPVTVDDLRADPRFEATLVAAIARSPAWQAKCWLLERMHPDRWGRAEAREVTGARLTLPLDEDAEAALRAVDELAERRRRPPT